MTEDGRKGLMHLVPKMWEYDFLGKINVDCFSSSFC